MMGRRGRDELLVERGLAVQIGGEQPLGHEKTPAGLDKGMTNGADSNLSERFGARPPRESA
jgi:hypothetical protein